MSKIINLKAENIKRLQAVEITPDGNMVIVGGQNGQGKTSVLDSIMYALAGKSACCERPVRDGQERGEVSINIGEYVITRSFTASGGGTLKVTNKDGASYSSPQGLLNQLCGSLSFDPLEFMRQDLKKQAETLKRLVGLDFTEIDRKRAGLYEERTIVNRDIRNLEGQLANMPLNEGVLPLEPLSMSELLAERDTAQEHNKKGTDLARELTEADSNMTRLSGELEHAKTQLAAWQKKIENIKKSIDDVSNLQSRFKKSQDEFQPVNIDDIQSRITSLESTNQKIRENQARTNVVNRLADIQLQNTGLTSAIKKIDDEKANALAATQFPVVGLSFDGEGVTFNSVPLNQASGAEQLRVSAAIAAAMNPQLRVMMIRDGSLLDENSMKLLSDFAAHNDFQIWIERVGEGAECSVIIEDGNIKA